MRKPKLDRCTSKAEFEFKEKRIQKHTKSNIALVDDYKMFLYILSVTQDLLYNYANLSDIAYSEEQEKIFLHTYDIHCKLLDKAEVNITKKIDKFTSNGAKNLYLGMLRRKLKEKGFIQIPFESVCELERNDLALYYNVKANIKLIEEFLVDKLKEHKDVIGYFHYTKIKLLGMLKLIREEFNSGVPKEGVLLK